MNQVGCSNISSNGLVSVREIIQLKFTISKNGFFDDVLDLFISLFDKDLDALLLDDLSLNNSILFSVGIVDGQVLETLYDLGNNLDGDRLMNNRVKNDVMNDGSNGVDNVVFLVR